MKSDTKLAVFFCCLLALQFGLQPMIASKFTGPGVSKSSIVIAAEIGKILIAAFTFFAESSEEREKVYKRWTFIESLKVAALPATLYAIQNLFVQYGYALLDSMTFNLLNQTKTISAAFWLWILMGNRQSGVQMFALVLLLVAAIILNLPENTSIGSIGSTSSVGIGIDSSIGEDKGFSSDYSLGLFFVASASMLSGLCAALTSMALVGFRKQHSFFFSAELAVFGIVFLLGNLLVNTDIAPGDNNHLFSNWTLVTILPVVTSTCGGLLVGLVMKYADGVVKGFALIAGILITGLAQFLIEGKPLGSKSLYGVLLVSASIYLHSKFPPAKKKPLTGASLPPINLAAANIKKEK